MILGRQFKAIACLLMYDVHFPKNNQNVQDIKRNVEENEILHEIIGVVSRLSYYVSCYSSENRLPFWTV